MVLIPCSQTRPALPVALECIPVQQRNARVGSAEEQRKLLRTRSRSKPSAVSNASSKSGLRQVLGDNAQHEVSAELTHRRPRRHRDRPQNGAAPPLTPRRTNAPPRSRAANFISSNGAGSDRLSEPAPLLEMKFAARGLRRGIRAPWGERWRCAVLRAVPMSARPAVRQLGGHFSWALSPRSAVSPDFDEALDTALGLDRERVREELALFFSAPNSGVPLLHRYAFEGDRDAGRVWLHGMRTTFAAAVQPYWADVRANHYSELAQCGRLLACRGVGAALTAVIPGRAGAGTAC